MLLDSAIVIADSVLEKLYPHCERIEIAGSIRRRKPDVGDIEIVCTPKGKLHPQKPRGGVARPAKFVPIMPFIEAVNQWQKVKGEPWDKYTQRIIRGGIAGDTDDPQWEINCDIFMVNKINWGYQMAIRTGDFEYSHKVLATGWVKKGYHGDGGYLTKNGEIIVVLEERELFGLIGIPYVQPWDRHL